MNNTNPMATLDDGRPGPAFTPQACCASCAPPQDASEPATSAFVYALGRIEARFPALAVEKEFAQATARADTVGKTDPQAFHAVLSQPENRYLVRQLCWVLTIQGLDTYLLTPRDAADFSLLVEALRPTPHADDVDVVIGMRGPPAPPTMCNGLMLPIVAFEQVYSFDRALLIGAIPRPDDRSPEQFGPAAEQLFGRIMQMTDNAGTTDEHRALNYLAVRYPAIYARAAEAFAQDAALTSVDVRRSSLSGARNIVDVIFAYTNRNTDFTEKCFVRCDVSGQFPFLVTKLSPYYDR